MIEKITNYTIEKQHDWCLICLVRQLNEEDRLDIFRDNFGIEEDLGPLIWSGRRRPFDVELIFDNLSIAIETKVHADEHGRWSGPWQTERIAKLRRKEKGLCFFVTYGASEFYTKPYETGPASPEFQHVSLKRMIGLVESSLAAVPKMRQTTDSVEWLRLMKIEEKKREESQELLRSFSVFRRHYLEIQGENDFPRGCVAFSAPELAFPIFSKLVKHWEKSEYTARFGRLAVYPVGRAYSPVVDSVLNFWDLWQEGNGPVLAPDIVGSKQYLYIEINEDFNLNLKLDGEPTALEKEKKEQLWKCLQIAKWPPSVYGSPREYKQQNWVYYEIDFGFLENVDCLSLVVQNLGRTLEVLFGALHIDCE